MGIMFGLLLVILHLVCIGIDIAIFFLLIRLVLMRRSISWLERLNDVGRGLVDAVIVKAATVWDRAVQKQLSDRGAFLVSLLGLLLVRLLLCEAARLL